MGRTSNWYSNFSGEAHGRSLVYEGWATGVAGDEPVLRLLHELPLARRQPNLIFAVSRLLGAPEGEYGPFRDWLVAHWPAVRQEALRRSTQTNEPGRCAAVLPLLARLPGPLALLEVGASAGLCLYPDRYSYRYDAAAPLDPAAGPSTVLLECETRGSVPIPTTLPTIVWRAGIDLAPLDVRNQDDRNWLETLIWPEQHARLARIRLAIDIVSAHSPRIVPGDAVDALATVAAQAPAEARLVVVSCGTLVYLSRVDRARFVTAVRCTGAHWISLEGPAVLAEVQARLPAPPDDGMFVLAENAEPVAYAAPHGHSIHWLAGA
ncbi:hypothetical protein GCM10027052_16550 [Parafrigoribacterium mesophilum]|uniref:DUF2332 domain-containing protein n=1 Tax=Parafrigoribacterium mesophilum TaxID=433646 RepID=UPI0031FC1F98